MILTIEEENQYVKESQQPDESDHRPQYQMELLQRVAAQVHQRRHTQVQRQPDHTQVGYSFSLEDAIVQLVDFDDNKLFPYIRKLIDTLEDILKPSPMI